MRINVHTHIFNLQCILTHETIEIIVRRLRESVVGFVADGVQGVLESVLEDPRFLSEEELLRLFLKKIGVSDAYKKAVKKLTTPVPALDQFGVLDMLPMAGLQAILDALSTQFDKKDTAGGGVFDIYQTLRIALKSDCTAVADEILGEISKEDAIVALMMDITSENEPDRDRRLFERQLRETKEAMLQRPGRVLPFVAVNTRRATHRQVLEDAITNQGFVGAKLYPSLGFPIADSPAMDDVVEFCARKDLPITMHCNHGGFSKDTDSKEFCNPIHWADHLATHPDLRICFAHFGGIEGLFGTSPEETEWTTQIVEFMELFPNVFADLSFHVDIMMDKEKEKKYFKTLRTFMAMPGVSDSILFGSDSWLLRMHLGERNYWRYFEEKLTPDEFAQLADVNPRRFLGLPPDAGGPMGASITRYVDFMRTNRLQVGAAPVAWLKAAVNQEFIVQRHPPHWTTSNPAHMVTNFVMRSQMTQGQKDAGFAIAGTLRLRELLYFRAGQNNPAMFSQQCDSLAISLREVARQKSVAFEDGVTRDSSFATIRALVESGEETLSVLGGVVDSLFRFAEEPQ